MLYFVKSQIFCTFAANMIKLQPHHKAWALSLRHAVTFMLLCISTILSATPRLTVVVMVDGMTQENLTAMRPYWPAGGLRLLSEEAFQTTATFPHQVYGGQETTATLMTGTTPAYHSITSNHYFSRSERQPRPILRDKQTAGIGTHLQLSPRDILSTSVTDEWRMLRGTEAKIYAVGLQPEAAILMAGHAANACCWLDADTRKWVTTSFYPEGLPAAADEMNMSGRIDLLAEREWTPRMDIATYNRPTEKERKRSFSYTCKDYLLQSPAANTLVIEMALALQQSQKLGADLTPDLLLLQLNTLSPKTQSDAIESAEQEDMYLGINQDLGFLMEQLSKRIGKENYQILVMGRPVKGYSTATLGLANLQVQHFNVDRAAALTGTYLMAIYGHERWVDGGHGPFIYLNRMLIEKKRMSLETIQRQVANFLMDFEGVQVAYPIHEAITSEDKHSIYRKHAGDVYFRLQDNWLLDCKEDLPFDQVVQSQPSIPLLYWSGTITTFPEGKLQATDIKGLILND